MISRAIAAAATMTVLADSEAMPDRKRADRAKEQFAVIFAAQEVPRLDGENIVKIEENKKTHLLSIQCDLVEEDKFPGDPREKSSGIAQFSIDVDSKRIYWAKWTVKYLSSIQGTVASLAEFNDEEIIVDRERSVAQGDIKGDFTGFTINRRNGKLSTGMMTSGPNGRSYHTVEGQCLPLVYEIAFPQKKF